VEDTLLALTADIVAAHISNNKVATGDVPSVITTVYEALAGLAAPVEKATSAPQPAVSIRSSVKPDYIVCLEDGKKLKMMKRYLMTAYGMTPDEYRRKWGLSSDYPMAAPNYTETRRALAKQIGLGSKGRRKAAASAPAADAKGGGKATGGAKKADSTPPARPRRKRSKPAAAATRAK
jgi:predicted transcriptional regulator